MSTTRRVTSNELSKIKEIQQILKREGIQMTQGEISETFVDFTIQNLEEYLIQIRNNNKNIDNDRSELNRLVFESFDGKLESDSVEDHDVTI